MTQTAVSRSADTAHHTLAPHEVVLLLEAERLLVNAVIGFLQESKAEAALEGLRAMIRTETRAVRGGHARLMPTSGFPVAGRVGASGRCIVIDKIRGRCFARLS